MPDPVQIVVCIGEGIGETIVKFMPGFDIVKIHYIDEAHCYTTALTCTKRCASVFMIGVIVFFMLNMVQATFSPIRTWRNGQGENIKR